MNEVLNYLNETKLWDNKSLKKWKSILRLIAMTLK